MNRRLAHRIVFCLAAAAASACQGDSPGNSSEGVDTTPTGSDGVPGPSDTGAQPPGSPNGMPTPPPSNPSTGANPPPAGQGGNGPGPSTVGGSGGSSAGSGGDGASPGGTSPGGSPTAGGPSGGSPSGGTAGLSGGGSSGAAPGGSAGQTSGGSAGSSGGSAGASTGGVVPSSGCDNMDYPSSATYNIDVNGQSREYILRIPDDYDPSKPYRLILAFHWLNGTAQNVAQGGGTTKGPFYGLWDLAEGSAIFVAPQGINNSWPSGNVPFAEALIDKMTSDFCIDESRIFSTGFSMGGSMSYAVACGLGSRIRAVAVYSGGPMSGCDPHDEPVAYFMSHGTNDSVCRYPQFGVPELEDFAEINGCTPREMPQPSGNEPSCVDFEGCKEGYPTRACIFVGDHTPSPPNTQNTWVPQEAWNFLSQF